MAFSFQKFFLKNAWFKLQGNVACFTGLLECKETLVVVWEYSKQ